jgi:hypothetical protein
MEVVVSARRPASRKTTQEAAGMLRRFIEAVESGELMANTPQDVAVVRRLQGALTALEAVAGRPGRGSKTAG